jgi:hypothetical protein
MKAGSGTFESRPVCIHQVAMKAREPSRSDL